MILTAMPIKDPSRLQPASRHLLRRSFIVCLIILVAVTSGFTQSKAFVKKFRPMADSLSEKYGIPTAVILGISIIESSSGTSRNCRLLNNYFGIVGKNNLRKTKGIKTRYKQYPDAEASFKDFCRVISKKKYYKKLKGNMRYQLWIDAISKSAYSEAPVIWRQRITATVRKNKLSRTP
jgi:Bax protein